MSDTTTLESGVVDTVNMTDDQRVDAMSDLLMGEASPQLEEEPAQAAQTEEAEIVADSVAEPVDSEEEGAEVPPETDLEAGEATKGDEYTIESLGDVAKALELENPDDLLGLTTTVKVNGEEMEVSLADIKKSYQLEGHLNRKSIELSEAKKNYLAEIEATQSFAKEQALKIDDLAQQLAVQIDYDQQRLNAMRESDPEGYLVQKDALAEKAKVFEQALAQREQFNQQEQAANAMRQQNFIEEQRAKMLDLIPDWKDEGKAEAEKSKMLGYLNSLDFTNDEISGMVDARLVNMARKAMLFDDLQNAKPAITKKVTKAPKVVKSGKALSPKEAKQDSLKKLVSQARKSPSTAEDAVVALLRAQGM